MTIGIGIIGAGHFGAVHAAAIARQPDARLVAACSGRPETAAAFVAAHGGIAHPDWRALLDDPAVDAVVIATPHDRHVEIAVGGPRRRPARPARKADGADRRALPRDRGGRRPGRRAS